MRYSTYETSDMCWFRHGDEKLLIGYRLAGELNRGDRSVGESEFFEDHRITVEWARVKGVRMKRDEILKQIPHIDELVESRLGRQRMDEKLFDEVERQNYP